TSLELRRELGLRATDALESRALAKHLAITVYRADEIEGVSDKARQALSAENAGWSAVTLELPGIEKKLIILNHTHSLRRQSSDLTHEIAHHLCGHTPVAMQVSKEGLLMLETYSRNDEEQADWLSGCLLLPRPALMFIKCRMSDEESAASAYMVSVAMLKYRLAVTGVN